jgi:hypothetical protein
MNASWAWPVDLWIFQQAAGGAAKLKSGPDKAPGRHPFIFDAAVFRGDGLALNAPRRHVNVADSQGSRPWRWYMK